MVAGSKTRHLDMYEDEEASVWLLEAFRHFGGTLYC